MYGFADTVCFELRRNARRMALCALAVFLCAPLLLKLFDAGARPAERAVETTSALAGIAAMCAVFRPERARGVRESVAVRGVPVAALWGVRAAWLLTAVLVFSCGCALLLRAMGCDVGRRAALAGFANAAFTGGEAALCAALAQSAVVGAALPALAFALDLCGLAPARLTLFCDWQGLAGNKLLLCLCGLAMLAAALRVRTLRDG